MHLIRTIYKVIRGVLFTTIIIIAVVYLVLYVLLAVPAFQDTVKERVEREASNFIGSEVKIGNLQIKPFNEVVISGLEVEDKSGERCLAVETLGAGIRLWTLFREHVIEITYGEIIGLDARISQPGPDEPLNIAFIIDAFKPKDKTKPPTEFNLNLRNVVIRRSAISYDRQWLPRMTGARKTDFNHLRIIDLKADLNLPVIKNNDFTVDLRRLAFNMSGGLDVEKVALKAHITDKSISIKDLIIKLPATELTPSDITLQFDGFNNIVTALSEGTYNFVLIDNPICPADFSWVLPELGNFPEELGLGLELAGNLDDVDNLELSLKAPESGLTLGLKGSCENLRNRDDLIINMEELNLKASRRFILNLPGRMGRSASSPGKVFKILEHAGDIELVATAKGKPGKGDLEGKFKLISAAGDLEGNVAAIGLGKRTVSLTGEVKAETLDVSGISGIGKLSALTGVVAFDGSINGKMPEGEVSVTIDELGYNGYNLSDIEATVSKNGNEVKANIFSDNPVLNLKAEAQLLLEGEDSYTEVHADMNTVNPAVFAVLPEKLRGYTAEGRFDAELTGNNIDNISGDIRINDLALKGLTSAKKDLHLDHFQLKASQDSLLRQIKIKSDWINGELQGDFKLKQLPGEVLCMLSQALPCLVSCKDGAEEFTSDATFEFTIEPDNTLMEFFNLPFRLLVPIPVTGVIDATSNISKIKTDIPYLQQGKNKLISSTVIDAQLDGESGTLALFASTSLPVKAGNLTLDLQVFGQDDNVFTDIGWNVAENSSFNGKVSLGAALSRNELSASPEVDLDINPSVFDFGPARWNIDKSSVTYHDKEIDIDGLRIWHDEQFVEIEGTASASPLDSLRVKLASIDVGYIFDVLNINYVQFGGHATGEVTAYGALSKDPIASTDSLGISALSYNGAVLGDAVIRSAWHNGEKKVAISADIKGEKDKRTRADGGIWVTRDSLSFDIDTERVPVEFLQPFMSAFTSDVKGHASGAVKLFGTFKNVDLIGKVLADSVALKLDYTNVVYHGTDSVFLDPGKITVPSFRLYDKFGNSAILTGELTHNYFHDPRFTFRVSDVNHMLCYDTNSQINPDWYGTLFGNGSAVVRGRPGLVGVSVDMSVVDNSTFTFVLNDRQAAEDYKFLTFTDKRKEEAEKLRTDTVADIIKQFTKKVSVDEGLPSKFEMDIRASVGPSTLMTLVMDPIAGDKITTRGNGNIQVDYDTESDQMQMFGKYTLEEGTYNFSLQDLILRDFHIRQGSSISFNGDPLNAMLDISASYRVNTNISDLDKSFSTDRDLARTNVPVDAMLHVEGPMQQPDITFDIELPTLTQDVERKVKSIISTDDMMNRQIIYLLALNRFYTPEYMGSSSNGGELASVASSTLSSQLSNMLGQLTDKFSVAPSFRSDKGDFSDLEVDVALSSRLLNNRLLINGNFGYRDRATSQTTFVGDFDIEYLLRRGGNLRLKAYNHFNDQNYYLRQALTTQGLGLIYRKEFDNLFSIFKRRKRNEEQTAVESSSDSHEDDPHKEETEIHGLEEEE